MNLAAVLFRLYNPMFTQVRSENALSARHNSRLFAISFVTVFALASDVRSQDEVSVSHDGNRPAWVGQSLRETPIGVESICVSSEPWPTEFEARDALRMQVRDETTAYLNEYLSNANAIQSIGLEEADISDLIVDTYFENYDASVGTMVIIHAKLEFTPKFRATVTDRWHEYLRNRRTILLAALFGLLATVLASTLAVLYLMKGWTSP